MRSVLLNPDLTQLILVTLAEELPVTETLETLEWLAKEDVVAPPVVVANRVLEPLAPGDGPAGPVALAAHLHRSLYAEQQEWLGEIDVDLTLPYLFGLFTPGEVAAHLTDVLESVE
jgi:hypothetical protein